MIKIIVEPDISHFGNQEAINDGIEQAWKAGANFYKLQCYDMDKLGTKWADRYDYYKECMVTNDMIEEADMQCRRRGMELICTLNDPDQAKRVWDLGILNVKLASGQVVMDMLDVVTKFQWKRLFISTGMQGDSGLSTMYFDFEEDMKKQEEVVLMHCVSLYPPTRYEMNMLRVEEVYRKFKMGDNFSCGYSDHGGGVVAGIIAVALGADYIEHHVHRHSDYSPVGNVAIDYDDLKENIETYRMADDYLGNGEIISQEREEESWEKYKDRWVW